MDITTQYSQKSDWYQPIREVLLYDMNIPIEYITSHYMVNTFVTYLQDIYWTPNETVMLAIGQSITQVTPIAVARYVSAIVNGGTVYDAQIVDKIISADGQVMLDKEPVVANQIDTDSAYFAAIQEGMKDVTSEENGGTAARQFADARYPIAAKTGTSQRTKLDVENNAAGGLRPLRRPEDRGGGVHSERIRRFPFRLRRQGDHRILPGSPGRLRQHHGGYGIHIERLRITYV